MLGSIPTGPHGFRFLPESVGRAVVTGGIVLLLAASPLPYGSVESFPRAIIAVLAGIIGLAAMSLPTRTGAIPAWGRALMVLPIAAMLIQMLPLGTAFPALTSVETLGLTVAGPAISLAPAQTLAAAMVYAACCVLLVVLSGTLTSAGQIWLQALLLGIVALYAILGLWSISATQTIFGAPKADYLGYATGPFVNRNSFATYLGMGLVVAFTWILEGGGGRSGRVLAGAAFLLILMALIATGSRMGIACTIAAIGVVSLLWFMRSNGRTRPWIVLGVGVALLAASLLLAEVTLDRFITFGPDLVQRLALYEQTLHLAEKRPFTGFGAGTFELAFQLVHRPPVDPDLIWRRAHSTYLTILVELGYPVAFGLAALLVWLAIRLLRGQARLSSQRWQASAAAIGALTIVALHSLSDFSIEIPANAIVLSVLLGSGLAGTRGDGPPAGRSKD